MGPLRAARNAAVAFRLDGDHEAADVLDSALAQFADPNAPERAADK